MSELLLLKFPMHFSNSYVPEDALFYLVSFKVFKKVYIGGTPETIIIFLVGPHGQSQVYQQWDKLKDGQLERHDLMGVIYVPLTSVEKQLEDRT